MESELKLNALLTNQTKWVRIEPHLEEIRELFFDYDPEKILNTDPSIFSNGLFRLKCGKMSTKAQMLVLADNIRALYRIERLHKYISFYNNERPIKMFQYRTPAKREADYLSKISISK